MAKATNVDATARRQERKEGLARPAAHDRCDEGQVDCVEGGGREADLECEPREAVARDCRRGGSRAAGGEYIDAAVVRDSDRGLAAAELDDELSDERHEDRGCPAVEDCRADDEDGGEGRASDGDVLDGDRERLDESSGRQEREEAGKLGCRGIEGRE